MAAAAIRPESSSPIDPTTEQIVEARIKRPGTRRPAQDFARRGRQARARRNDGEDRRLDARRRRHRYPHPPHKR